MLRVLRHNQSPEECESSMTAEQLEARYGSGRLVEGAYLCALPKNLHDDLERINSAPGLPQISLEMQPADAIGSWLRVILKNPSLSKAVDSVFSVLNYATDEVWAEHVRATAQDRCRPLVLVTPPPPALPREELPQGLAGALSQGWDRRYEDPLDVVGYLAGEVDACMDKWKGGTYHAAWTMVLQSSGWGKSRSMQQLATRGFHVAYVSFLSSTSSGIPPRRPVADLLRSLEARDPRFVAAWVVAILVQIGNASPEEWMAKQLAESFLGDVTESYNALKVDVSLEVPDQRPSPGEHWDTTNVESWISHHLDGVATGKKVVFCLDEAGSLFKDDEKAFVAFRRFFSAIPQTLDLFGCLVDTTGKLGMVFPPPMFDSSARALDPTALFFQPVWVVGSAWRDFDALKRLMSQGSLPLVSKEFTKELFKMGRPLWRTACEVKSVTNTVKFAQVKLLGGVSLATLTRTLGKVGKVDKVGVTDAMATAIIGVLAGLEVASWSELAQSMVASHMRTVSHVSGDRERVFTADVIEPILAEAAAFIVNDTNVLLQVLKVMGGVFKQAYVVEGPRGEIVGRLLLVLAMQSCCKREESGTFSRPVELSRFLTELSGLRVKVKGLVFFNRFMFLNRQEITNDLLLVCFLCGFAIIPQRHQAGYDVLLPRLIPGPDGKYELQPDRMRAVPVQIRNRQAATIKVDKLLENLSSWSIKEETVVTDMETDTEPGMVASTETQKAIDGRERIRQLARDLTREHLKRENMSDQEYFGLADHFEGPAKRRRIVKGKEVEFGDECGLYLHVQAKDGMNQVEMTEDSRVLVLRGLRFPFLPESVSVELDNMCNAFFKLEDELEENPTRGKFVRHTLNNYFKLRKLRKNETIREPDLLLLAPQECRAGSSSSGQ